MRDSISLIHHMLKISRGGPVSRILYPLASSGLCPSAASRTAVIPLGRGLLRGSSDLPGAITPAYAGDGTGRSFAPYLALHHAEFTAFHPNFERKILLRLLFVASLGSNFALQNSTRLCGTGPHRPSLRTAGGPDVIGVRCPVVSGLSSPALAHRGGRPARLGKTDLYDRLNLKRTGADKTLQPAVSCETGCAASPSFAIPSAQ